MKMPGRKKGQALVEFAIIVVLFILFIVAFFDFGRMMLDYSMLNSCVREGTRMAVVGASQADINTRIDQICGSLDGFNLGNVSYYYYTAGDPEDQKARITITYDYTPFTPGIELLLGKIPLHAQAETYLAPFATQ